jgi:divalent metal cation (Fe/Co/Zn/Cd) transporter
MKKEKNGILDTIASILVVFVVFALIWYIISEYINAIKNPQTRTATLIATTITIILMALVYNNPEFIKSLIKE